MSKYLITGITGFVGANLAQRLYNDGHEVHALVRSSNGREADILDAVTPECFNAIKFHYGDLLDLQSLKKIFAISPYNEECFAGVFHLAAQSHPPTGFLDPIGTLKTNLIGSANLFQAVGKFIKICVVSTSEVYGNSGSDGRLLKETDSLAPSNPYATGKSAMDLHFQERMANGYNTGFITRAFSHTGPRRGKTFSISCDAYQLASIIVQEKLIQNESPLSYTHKLNVGNLETVRVVLPVENVVDAYVKLMYCPNSNGQIFNVCGELPRKMSYFTDKLIEISGLKIDKVVDPSLYRKHDIFHQNGDTTKLRELTGWKPEDEKIDETLNQLLNYWIKKLS